MKSTTKIEIASELLDRALHMYYEGNSYFASLHLAGAAEEILAAYLKKHGRPSAFERTRNLAVMLAKTDIVKDVIDDSVEPTAKDIANLMTKVKNATKHMDATDELIYCDIQVEAKDMLDRAVANYYDLMSLYALEETTLLRRFNAELVKQ